MSWKKEKFCPEIQSEWLEICYDGSQWDGGKVMAIQSDIRNTFNKWPSVLTTYSEIRDTLLCRGVTKNLTPCRINIKIFKKYHVKAYDQSFPIMYNTI